MLSIFNQDILVLNLIYRYIYKNHFTKFLQTRTLQFEMMYYRYKSCIKSVYVNNFIFYTNIEAVNTIPFLLMLMEDSYIQRKHLPRYELFSQYLCNDTYMVIITIA